MRSLRSYLFPVMMVAGSFAASLAVRLQWPDQTWVNEPLHAAMESVGAMAAVAMAFVLFERRHERGDGQARRLALGFLGMGLIELFHAMASPGHAFVLLRTAASLVGGAGFVLIWLPAAHPERFNWRALSWGLTAAAVAFGLVVLSVPDSVPPLLRDGRLGELAIAGRAAAGALFLAGAGGWLADYRRLGRSESYLFACLALLFGLTELLVAGSSPWQATWWYWHGLRLAAYALVLGFVGLGYVRIVADLRDALSRSRRSERRAAAQYAVTRALVESSSLAQSSPSLMAAIGDSLDWELGAFWNVDEPAGVLRCLDVWHQTHVRADEFVAVSRHRTFTPGMGLPGRVWASGEAAWIPDVLKDPNFPRAPYAARAGLHGAFGFPVRVAGRVHGVLEFFSRDIREPDPALLQWWRRSARRSASSSNADEPRRLCARPRRSCSRRLGWPRWRASSAISATTSRTC